MTKTRVALLGYGYLGKWHAQKLFQNSEIDFVVIVEPNIKMHIEIQSTYKSVKVVTDINDIIHVIDAAVVVTPTSLHEQHVKYLLDHNKHVFCEKPLAHNYAAAKSLYALAKSKSKLVTQVGHSERCHKILHDKQDYLKNLIQQDGLCQFERYGAFKGRATDVSCVEDIMVHDLDLMMFVFKPNLMSCTAKGIKSKTKNWDTVQAIFKTKNQTFTFLVSRDATEEKRMMTCFGSTGTAVVNFMNNKWVITNELELTQTDYEKRDHLTFEQHAYFDSIKNTKAAMVDFYDGLLACYLVEVVLRALETGETQAVVIPQ